MILQKEIPELFWFTIGITVFEKLEMKNYKKKFLELETNHVRGLCIEAHEE